MSGQLQQHRHLLDAILDQLIPANPVKRIPAAGEFGVGAYIEVQADQDENVRKALQHLLASAEKMNTSVNPEMVAQLESADNANFNLLLSLTYKGYYHHPEIRAVLGLASWPVHPKGYDVPAEPSDFIEKLVAPVVARGDCFRDPDNEQSVTS